MAINESPFLTISPSDTNTFSIIPLTEEYTWYWSLLLMIPEAYTDSVIDLISGLIFSCFFLQE
jgi:hypothetical protein